MPSVQGRRNTLLESQNEIIGLIARGAVLSEILHAVVRAVEAAIAPALCSLTVISRDGKVLDQFHGPHLPARLVALLDDIKLPADAGEADRLVLNTSNAVSDTCVRQTIRSSDGSIVGKFNLFHPRHEAACAADDDCLHVLGQLAAIAMERDQSTHSLRLADERFSSLVGSIPGVVYQRRVAPDGDIRYTYISEGVRDLFGVAPEMVLADPTALFDRHDPTYAADFRERLVAASRSLEMWDVEATIISPDGQQKYTHAIARPHLQPDGAVLWNGLILDQTRIKKAELAAAAAQASTREAIVESLSQGLVMFDAQDRLLISNSSFVKLYPQLAEIATVGATYAQIVAAELACEIVAPEGVDDRLQARLEQHKLGHHSLERHLADGRWILVSERRAKDGGTIVLHSDISILKRREEERSNLQDQLYRAQKMEAMGRLAGGVAHDFNNILASILGNAGFLVEDLPADSETAEYAQEIVVAGQRAKHLVQQILAFSRQQNVAEEDVDSVVVVDEAIQLLRATIPKSIDFDAENCAAKAMIRGNTTQLVQVVMNLCVNARDAIGNRHGVIELDTDIRPAGPSPSNAASSNPPNRVVEAPDGSASISTGAFNPDVSYLRIRVSDSGCGMSAKILQTMFEPFFTTKEVGKGTGLGLAAVHGIVTSHGGIVACTSKPGSGTTFEIFLPTTSVEASTVARISAKATSRGNEAILLVDDEQQVSAVLARGLKRLGYRVDCFNNGVDALAAFRKNPTAWSLAITDQTMPQMTGYELAEQILAEHADFPMILCSGFTDAVTAESAAAAGIKAFLSKPVDHEVISRTIRELLDRRCAA